MRIGLLAAAAAALLCSGQADAARYFEFNLTGQALMRYDVGGPPPKLYTDRLNFAFDTAQTSTAYFAKGLNLYIILQPDEAGTGFILQSAGYPQGPIFNFRFAIADVSAGDTFGALTTSNVDFAYVDRLDPRYATPTVRSQAGTIVQLVARTSDTAPTSLDATERLFITAVPEPRTWGMMIAGVALAGFGIRRRKRQPADNSSWNATAAAY